MIQTRIIDWLMFVSGWLIKRKKPKATGTFTISTVWLLFMVIQLPYKGKTTQLSCDFNQLCLCQNYTAQYIDVTCVNVPLVSVPTFARYRYLYRIRLIGVRELTQLKANDFENLITLASLTISKSRLSYVNPDTFKESAIKHTLTSVDLSYGNLIDVPVNAFTHLPQLQWVSLKGNQIEQIRPKDLTELKSLHTLLLNENLLSVVEDRTFRKLTKLEVIDLDGNMIERVEGNPFPSTLKSLSISNCLLRKIPFASVQNLPNLQVLQLQGNLISHLSPFKLQVGKMEVIDLSHNLISNLPEDLFVNWNRTSIKSFAESQSRATIASVNETKQLSSQSLNDSQYLLQVQKFHLDFNFIQSLPPALFRDILIEKLTLSSNRISSQLISLNAFQGPLIRGLKVLDLNYNLIDKYPTALKLLQALRQLLLKNNRIKEIDSDAFEKSAHTLEVLDLSQNLVEKIPKTALNVVKNLIKLNLHDNLIRTINHEDLDGWCHKLKSLTLSKNNLVSIGQQTFRTCTKLNELRLGANKLLKIGPNVLTPHLNEVQLLDLSWSNNANQWISETSTNKMQIFPQVKWLQFDFNFLQTISSQLIQLFPSLMYMDLQNNKISQLPSNLGDIENLTTIILSHNNLTSIGSKSFSHQLSLENIAIYFNRIKRIERHAFIGLPKLQSLVLSKNQISLIEADAFYNLSSQSTALTLMLDENQLECLSANSFRHIATQNAVSGEDFALYLNASHNQIKTFANCFELDSPKANSDKRTARRNQVRQTLPIRVLDISFNQIDRLTADFLRTFCAQALSLFVNNNLIRSLPINLLSLCPRLQTLSINYNLISGVDTESLFEQVNQVKTNNSSPNNKTALQIQTLSLKHNKIKELTSFVPLFNQLFHLKSLDITGNQISEIPPNFFSKTSLVKLNMGHNQLSLEENTDKCFGIGESLKYIDISYNSLTTLPKRVVSCANLIELIASNNRIRSFNYISPLYSALSHLHRLDLYDNPIDTEDQRISFMFVNNHSMLSTLNLQNLNIVHLEEINVPYLYTLELSGNGIKSINSKILSRSRNIRHLSLGSNQLHEVPKHIWKYVTRLRYLNLRDNPIDILDSSSFAGLKYLKYLDIRGLKLQYIDARIFLYQSQLSTLKISTYPQIRSFRLQDILAKSDALKSVVIEVKESILSHQIQWAFGGKLRELIITGKNLVRILPDAFQGLNNANDLTLRITNTSIRQLPDGLLRYLADIRYITIDLKNNLLETVSPAVFFKWFDSKDSIKSWQSRQLLGGIILENNPLKCDCNLLWISKWMKEIFTEMKSINIAAAIHVKSALALSRCQLYKRQSTEPTGSSKDVGVSARYEQYQPVQIPIIHLLEEDIEASCDLVSSNANTNMLYCWLMIQLLLVSLYTHHRVNIIENYSI